MAKVTGEALDMAIEQADQPTFKDYITLAKMGIVRADLITVFAGYVVAASYITDDVLLYLWQTKWMLLWTLLGSGLVIAGSCYLNNYIDRDIDYKMERTMGRPSVTGKMDGQRILALGLGILATGTVLLLIVNHVAAVFGLIGSFVYVVIYTMWLKRTHTINTVVGGISGAVPPIIGFAAVTPTLHIDAWILFLIMFVWQPPHFLALAMRRTEEYRAAGIPMLPVVNGFAITKRQIVWWIAVLIPSSLLLAHYGIIYMIVMALLGGYWLYMGLKGLKIQDEQAEIKWASKMFFFSLFYFTAWIVTVVLVSL
ncbi:MULTISPECIES: heme o synthase [Exiguobacterium]|uniref:heme o synthase n=1 Tax=Exiguobacterium TaxID=33986 RepID=UPI00049479C3|nr:MULTISPECIES: heme o synthase [Exiguobacterium]HCD59766.1 protoheme IX farnesyltransferase [Exiguobacterium sp.]